MNRLKILQESVESALAPRWMIFSTSLSALLFSRMKCDGQLRTQMKIKGLVLLRRMALKSLCFLHDFSFITSHCIIIQNTVLRDVKFYKECQKLKSYIVSQN